VSVWQDLWASFKAVFGPVATVAALALAVWGGLYPPAAAIQISIIWIVVAVIVVIMALATAWDMVATARRHVRQRLPGVRAALLLGEDPAVPAAAPVTLLLDRSELFGSNLLVTIFYNQPLRGGPAESVERPIGVGRVSNIQQDGRIQILVLLERAAEAETWQRIRCDEVATLAHIVVKPSVAYGAAGIEVRFNE